MIDFSTLQGLTIPEGVVTQITDASGRVLWSAQPQMVTVTIKYKGGGAWFDHSELGEEVSDGTYQVSPGSLLTCWAQNGGISTDSTYVYFYVNGQERYYNYLTSPYQKASYNYTITTNVIVTYEKTESGYEYVYITEYPVGAVALEVEKITSDTYAGETTYTGEQFILLDIYPKTNGTVKVTYGGLTKTITDTSGAAEPNAQQVFFGTFNGVTDSVTTPTSGMLTIEGKCRGFGIGTFQNGSKTTNVGYCSCITGVSEFGEVESIPDYAFYKCNSIPNISFPEGIKSIGQYAVYKYYETTNIVSYDDLPVYDEIVIPSTVTSLGKFALCLEHLENLSSSQSTHYHQAAKKIKVLAQTPPTIADTLDYPLGSFNGDMDTCTIEVPKGCGEAYKAATGWSGYQFRIVEASE